MKNGAQCSDAAPDSSQAYLLMLSQFLHLFSLNELVDVSNIYSCELSRIRARDEAFVRGRHHGKLTRLSAPSSG